MEDMPKNSVKYQLEILKSFKHEGMAVFMVTDKGHIIGGTDDSRFIKAKWYQKILCFFSGRYKSRFIDILPMKLNKL